jgi:phenylalanyl-tRNA synthetase alpha chain
MVELSNSELKTLEAVQKLGNRTSVERISEASQLAHSAIMRSLLKLSEENFIQIHEETQTHVKLTEEGVSYSVNGLPERVLIKSLIQLGGKAEIRKAAQHAKLEPKLTPIALGWLRKKRWATIEGKTKLLKASRQPPTGTDEEILKDLAEGASPVIEQLNDDKRKAIMALRNRKLLETRETTSRTVEITPKGKEALEKGVEIIDGISQLTPELIVSRKWREKKIRKFNVTAPGPLIFPGKIHPLQQIIERARRIFLNLGFTEIRGPLVETAFWNFDALFQPQDHPAREMMDTFYLSNPKAGKLPTKDIVKSVAETHENGWTTGSKGWGYKWSMEEAKRLVLRTHTTAETIKYLSKHKEPPIKVFSVDRVYRNEQLTSIHTAEFYQIEGIVVDKGVTLRDLMGTLQTFYSRFRLKKVKFWPCYFPYTEPSAQAMVFVPDMGMFRPEVLAPMGIEYPVLAWGGGLERIAMLELGLNDIRLLYGNRLDWIRRTPLCQ